MVSKKNIQKMINNSINEAIKPFVELQKDCGYSEPMFVFLTAALGHDPFSLIRPDMSINERVDALYRYLKLNPERIEKESRVVAKKVAAVKKTK